MPRWLLIALLFPFSAFAAPYPVCHWYWDLAVTSRAMMVEGIPIDKARSVIWVIFKSSNVQVIANGNRIIDLVYSPIGKHEEFVSQLGQVCEERQGQIEGILGVES